MSHTREQLENWLSNKMVSGNVLDVGGSQLPVEGRVHKMPETKFFILDLAHPHEKKKEPDIVADIEHDEFENDEQFDFAFCLEVSEYWICPLEALTNIAKLMKKGGRLYISFHFIYPVHNPFQFDSLRYTRTGVKRLLHAAGFDIFSAVSRKAKYPDLLNKFIGSEGMRPVREGYDFHDEVGILIEAIKL